MKLTRTLAATIAALSIFAATPHAAFASEVTPAQIAGNTPQSVIKVGKKEGEEPGWRKKLDANDARVTEMWASSPAMDNREVPLVVIKAADPNRPVLYLLNGADGGEGNANWIVQTDVVNFYKEKNVNVVIPMAGKFSYYTDWVSDSAKLGGKQKWETFLTKELPGPLEKLLKGNGKRGVAGMSMSATSSMLLAEHNPKFYDGVASFSGCYASSKPVPAEFVNVTLNRGGVSREQMWGPLGGPEWQRNDVHTQAEGLRGSQIYVSNGTGLAGEWDMPNGPKLGKANPLVASVSSSVLVVEGGAIEAATNTCTHDLKKKLESMNIPANFVLRNTGTHSWSYWEQDLRDSWPTFEKAFS